MANIGGDCRERAFSVAFLYEMDTGTGLIAGKLHDRGLDLRDAYQGAKPFPHIVIDDFLPPEVLDLCLAHFPAAAQDGVVEFDRPQERLKFQFNPDALDAPMRTLFYGFNSRPFLTLLENVTGIKGLVPDPYFLGGGFHEIRTGGHLSVHTDFNHHKPMNLERRLNVLIYLNKDWEAGFGGELELWNADMSASVASIVPVFNRCVVFSTTDSSFHGNPNPVCHPEGKPRRSIALYYYTSTWDDAKREHTTQFKVRRGTGDAVDLKVKRQELIADLTPPILRRALQKIREK